KRRKPFIVIRPRKRTPRPSSGVMPVSHPQQPFVICIIGTAAIDPVEITIPPRRCDQRCSANQPAEMRTLPKITEHHTVMHHGPAAEPTHCIEHIVSNARAIPLEMRADTAARARTQRDAVHVIEQLDRVAIGVYHDGGSFPAYDISHR